MKHLFSLAGLLCAVASLSAAEPPPTPGPGAKSMFDGSSLAGWEGNAKLWRVEDGCLTGGSLTETVRANDFLATTRDYTNFIVRFQIRLLGSNGFINSGFQIRSQRVPNSSEMRGYQCDYGEPGWYGAIYDEERRNRLVASSDMKALRPALNPNREGWNDYVIRADGVRVTTWINGVMGVDYFEQETGLPNFDWGKLGIQIHGGGKGVVQVKQITIEELPPTPPGKIFRGAPEPKKSAAFNEANRAALQTAGKGEPVSPEEELARFTVAPGFKIELVASEDIDAGIGKFITVDWDQQGNLWTMTALEYPVDANEAPAVAKELYASRAKDKVLVYARDAKSPTGYSAKPRVFADGLAIPLGILPYKNGVYVQHGTEIVFLSDTDGDGKADKRDVILGGFGVQDSHLFPHQFTRAPGGWIWFAQGAFNYGKVKTTRGSEVQFDQTRMAKFRYDGSDFDITSQGPCNIWGLHMTMEGETWIQEANDFGYPAMPFHEYANYPGCSGAQWKSYAPEFPGTAPHFQMGGTGLSGLAMSDKTGWPEAYADVIYIANPITRKIQAIKARREGGRYALTKLPDFIQSSDEMFRPVALRLGPDGCLYFVDWYNKIISHNEVPRNHPERDKKRGRIWRVRPENFQPLDMPDFTKASGDELIAKLGGENTAQSHLAWQAIGDRQMKELAPKLKTIVGDKSATAAKRIASLWALEAIAGIGAETFGPLLKDGNRNVRRELVRAMGEAFMHAPPPGPGRIIESIVILANDPEPEVRAEVMRVCGRALAWNLGPRIDLESAAQGTNRIVEILLAMARAPLDQPTMKSTQSGKTIKTGDAYDREFERYLARLFLERHPAAAAAFLKSSVAVDLPAESRLVAALALEPKASAPRVAELLPVLKRAPGQEELLRLAQFPDEPGVGEALKKILQQPATSTAAIESLLKVRTKLDAAKVTPLLNDAAKQLWEKQGGKELALRLVSSFQLGDMESEITDGLLSGHLSEGEMVAALQASRELGARQLDGVVIRMKHPSKAVRDAALAALASSRNVMAPDFIFNKFWGDLDAAQRRAAFTSLAGTKHGASATVKSVRSGVITKDELDAVTLDKLQAVLGNDADLAALMADMASFFRPALRLNGEDNAVAETDLKLEGPFTVETWVKLDAGIDNNDGILGVAGVLDMNFFGGQFRVWIGGGVHDAIIAKKKITPDVWTHIAVTRDGAGNFRIYQNGELDNGQGRPSTNTFEHLNIGWTAPAKGTAGWLSEYRIWNLARTDAEIRADFDRSFEGEAKPVGLTHYFPGAGPWGKLRSGAKVVKTSDFPLLLTPAESKALAEKFSKFHSLADKAGDSAKGKALFATVCQGCHSVGGTGGQIGPVLNGAGALGVEALLRNILTPNAAMEPGYRVYRVELKDGDVLDGIRVSEDKDAIVLRRQNMEDTRIPQSNVRKAGFTKSSMMPEGLLDGLPPEQVSDLFAYLKSLK
jgi:putative membrane-bound dehydrogenase-like protein